MNGRNANVHRGEQAMRGKFEERSIIALTKFPDSPYKLGSAFVFPNCEIFTYEMDLVVVKKNSIYATEIELKASLSDLRADRKKEHNHYSPFIRSLYFGLHESIPIETAKKYIPDEAGIIIFYEIQDSGRDNIWEKQRAGTLRPSFYRRPKPRKDAAPISQHDISRLFRTMYYKYYNLLFKTQKENQC